MIDTIYRKLRYPQRLLPIVPVSIWCTAVAPREEREVLTWCEKKTRSRPRNCTTERYVSGPKHFLNLTTALLTLAHIQHPGESLAWFISYHNPVTPSPWVYCCCCCCRARIILMCTSTVSTVLVFLPSARLEAGLSTGHDSPTGWVSKIVTYHGSGRVGSDRVAPGRVGSGDLQTALSRVRSGHP